MEAAIAGLQVIKKKCEQEEDLKITEERWMFDLGTLFVGLNLHNEVLSNKRRNFGAARIVNPQCPFLKNKQL